MLTNEQRRSIYRRDGYRCALCDSTRYLQVHHYIHAGEGGSDHPFNLITLCHVCHGEAHGSKMLDHPDELTQEDMEQLIVEYLSDYYAGEWNPWQRESQEAWSGVFTSPSFL